MKRIYLCAVSLLLVSFLSCNKQKLTDLANEESVELTVESSGRLEDQAALVAFAKHQESSPTRGYHNDKALDTTKAPGDTAIMRYGSILFSGNSLFKNFKDDTAWRVMAKQHDVIDRGIGGSMWMDLYTHRDSMIFDYKPRQIVLYMMENEISYYINTRPTWTVAQLIANDSLVIKSTIFEFNRLYDAIRAKLPKTHILILSPNHCPFHVNRGMTRAIDTIAAAYKRKVNEDVAMGNKAVYLETNGINDDPIYYRDNIHFKLPSNAYGRWAAALKPHFIKRTASLPPVDTVVVPPVDPKAPVANAGPDQVIRASMNYCRINASLSKAYKDSRETRWITSVIWEQISGPKQLGYSPANQNNTTLTGIVPGVFVFRCKVTDNKGAVGYDECKITFTPVDTVVVPPGDTVVIPPVDPKAPIANAGPDQIIRASMNYCRINASLSKAYKDSYETRWITSVIWEQVSGPKQLGYSPANQNNTTLTGIVPGTFVFKCKVTDNKGSVSYDECTVTFN